MRGDTPKSCAKHALPMVCIIRNENGGGKNSRIFMIEIILFILLQIFSENILPELSWTTGMDV